MIKLKIDQQEIEIESGSTILDAARKADRDIPTMCYLEDTPHFTSCMICMVKERSSGKLIPSCSAIVQPDMDIITEDGEITESRKTALELLLSDHVGDCEAPCQIACPAHMDIPQMNRLLAKGKIDEAFEVVIKDISMPAVLGRICPAPCEGVCKRKPIDGAVSICLLKRFAGDHADIADKISADSKRRKEKVAIIGAGPAGLSAAFYLSYEGFEVFVFDKNEKPGGNLQYALDDLKLPKHVLDNEIQYIIKKGASLYLNEEVTPEKFKKLRDTHDAVVIAAGDTFKDAETWGLERSDKGLFADKITYQTNIQNVFAIGNVLRSSKLAIRSLGQGKEVSKSIVQFLDKKPLTGESRRFNSRVGKLLETEFDQYLKEASGDSRLQPQNDIVNGFTLQEVQGEAARCMHCDCRKPEECKLRIYADQYAAEQKRFSGEGRAEVRKNMHHDHIVYEPEKCIKCGICVRLTEKHGEEFGFTYIGRGFEVEVTIPFDTDMQSALKKTAHLVADHCPTGALARKG